VRNVLEIVQEIIGAVLFFVLLFGIGFIINMLVKTTWLPAILWVVIFIPLGIWHYWKPGLTLGSFLAVWLPAIISSTAGAIASGWAIRKLRKSGYKMF